MNCVPCLALGTFAPQVEPALYRRAPAIVRVNCARVIMLQIDKIRRGLKVGLLLAVARATRRAHDCF